MAKILLVDDDNDVLKLADRVLRTDLHTVVPAMDAYQAVEQLKSGHFDLMITDANMPHASGFDLVRGLRQNPAFKDLPIALLTARRGREDIDLALSLGVEDYIIKPIDPLLLQQKVRSILQRHERSDPTLGDGAFRGIPVTQKILLRAPVELMGLSEIGIRVRMTSAPRLGESMEVEAPIFREIGIPAPLCRIARVENEGKASWIVDMDFVGTGESRLQKIRAYMNHYLTQTRGKVS
jgi:two-component system chemotaxis response regulator CheY